MNMCGECASRTFPAVKEDWKLCSSTNRSWRRSAGRMPTAHQELAALHMRNAYDNMIKNGLLDAYDEKERIDG